ncbi:MAG: hypothetical protein ACJ76N_09930 [Thermoanaerobaculia bacterium]
MNRSRTKLEGLLFWWLVANFFLLAFLVLLAATLPSSVVHMTLYGSTSLVLVLIALVPVISAWIYLAWKMRAPTSRTLLFGAIFFLLSMVCVEWPDGLWSLNPVLAFRVPLIDNPPFMIHLDVVAGVISILFFVAWRRRAAFRQNATVEAPNNGTPLSRS